MILCFFWISSSLKAARDTYPAQTQTEAVVAGEFVVTLRLSADSAVNYGVGLGTLSASCCVCLSSPPAAAAVLTWLRGNVSFSLLRMLAVRHC
jgi:hypothetical protein